MFVFCHFYCNFYVGIGMFYTISIMQLWTNALSTPSPHHPIYYAYCNAHIQRLAWCCIYSYRRTPSNIFQYSSKRVDRHGVSVVDGVHRDRDSFMNLDIRARVPPENRT